MVDLKACSNEELARIVKMACHTNSKAAGQCVAELIRRNDEELRKIHDYGAESCRRRGAGSLGKTYEEALGEIYETVLSLCCTYDVNVGRSLLDYLKDNMPKRASGRHLKELRSLGGICVPANSKKKMAYEKGPFKKYNFSKLDSYETVSDFRAQDCCEEGSWDGYDHEELSVDAKKVLSLFKEGSEEYRILMAVYRLPQQMCFTKGVMVGEEFRVYPRVNAAQVGALACLEGSPDDVRKKAAYYLKKIKEKVRAKGLSVASFGE